mmetsp:Transcript_17103/g.14988  ORF Transcript_17103/g.14988 Transcript_17103/m.14988 type:complete len:217 (+) Transcript_17103:381-1031(+)
MSLDAPFTISPPLERNISLVLGKILPTTERTSSLNTSIANSSSFTPSLLTSLKLSTRIVLRSTSLKMLLNTSPMLDSLKLISIRSILPLSRPETTSKMFSDPSDLLMIRSERRRLRSATLSMLRNTLIGRSRFSKFLINVKSLKITRSLMTGRSSSLVMPHSPRRFKLIALSLDHTFLNKWKLVVKKPLLSRFLSTKFTPLSSTWKVLRENSSLIL